MAVNAASFRQLLARARTFCFERDIQPLRAMGLIRGGSLENAIVLTENGVMNGPLRFRDEFVRHKILDLLGDLALIGRPIVGEISATKAGHAMHSRFVEKLAPSPETRWKVSPDSLPRLVGQQKANLLFYTGRRVPGDEAVAMGMADVLVPLAEVRTAAGSGWALSRLRSSRRAFRAPTSCRRCSVRELFGSRSSRRTASCSSGRIRYRF